MTIGFPGARALIRTYRKTWPIKDGKIVGEPTKEIAYHLTSYDPCKHSAEELALFVRKHWGVESYHNKRDGAYLEDKTARRCNPKLQTLMMLARTIGLWKASQHSNMTTTEVQTELFINTRKMVHFFKKRGMQ